MSGTRNSSDPQVFSKIRIAIDQLTLGLNVAGTCLIIAIMVLVNTDVIGRGFFNAPLSGVPELVSMSIVAIVFLQIGQTYRMGKLTRSDALIGILKKRNPRLHALMEFIFCGIAIAVISSLLWASWPLFVKSWIRNTFEGTIGDFTAPIWPVKLIILIGCTTLLVQLIISAVMALREVMIGQPPQNDGEATRVDHDKF